MTCVPAHPWLTEMILTLLPAISTPGLWILRRPVCQKLCNPWKWYVCFSVLFRRATLTYILSCKIQANLSQTKFWQKKDIKVQRMNSNFFLDLQLEKNQDLDPNLTLFLLFWDTLLEKEKKTVKGDARTKEADCTFQIDLESLQLLWVEYSPWSIQ